MKKVLASVLALVMLLMCIPLGAVSVSAAALSYTPSSAYKASPYYTALSGVTLTGDQREDIVNIALSQVGYTEGSSANDFGGADDGSYNNYTEYNYWYHNYVNSGMPVGGSSAPWCATFVSWCAEQAGVPSSVLHRSTAAGHGASYFNVNFYSGSSTLASSSDNDSYFKGYNYTPKKGDLFFTKSWSHVGLVVGVSGQYVITVEGNTNNSGSSQGDGVYKNTFRKISDLYFGVPNYQGGTHKVDTSYGKNFTAYPKAQITADNIFDAYHNMISSSAWIGTADKCTIHEVYTDGCCKVTYPLDAGGTNTVYSKISLFDTSHTCNKGEFMFSEAVHPHYLCYACSICGTIWRNTEETNTLDWCLDCTLPGKPSLVGLENTYLDNESIVFKWDETKNTTHYNIWLEVKNDQGEWVRYDHLTYVTSGVTAKLPVGDYRCVLQAYNSKYFWEDGSDWQYTESDYHYFSVISAILPCNHTYDNACDTTCNVCGAVRTVGSHSYSSKITTAATCGADGVRTYICGSCGHSYAEAIPATSAHTYDNSCDTTCNVCGAVRTVGSHSYTSTVTNAATCGADGVRTYTCGNCGDSYTEVIPATGAHTYDDDYDADCNTCGAIREVPDKPTPDLPADAPTFVVDNVTAREGEEFTVAIRTERNSGIVSFKLKVAYDADVLELISVEEGAFASLSFSPITNNPFIINWVDAIHPNNTTDGVMALVTFRVKEGAPFGKTDITLSYEADDVYDQNYDNVAFRVENGFVEIVEYTPGDVNNDGKVNNKDLGLLQQYLNEWNVTLTEAAADTNGDGRVNNKDLGLLQQYLNEWNVELG